MGDESNAEWQAMMDSWDTDTMIRISFPSRGGDERFLAWGRRYMRALAGPSALMAYMNEMLATDVRSLLPTINVPTLVLHRREYQWTTTELDRFVSDNIADARFVEVPGGDASIYFGDSEPMLDAITSFLNELEPSSAVPTSAQRMMATILFTDIVSSTERASTDGDADWTRLLQVHDEVAADVVSRHLGRLIKNTGDGILAIFDGPGRGLLAAIDLRSALKGIGLPIRAGMHAGEVEIRGVDVAGIAVHIAARVMGAAGPGEILTSRTVRDLVFGSQFVFEDRGTHHLKGIDEAWGLLALV
jgi:class 3 adenylate cyclase